LVADVEKGEIMPKELLIEGGYVVTFDPQPEPGRKQASPAAAASV
jgi:hypothetical protein